MLPDQPQRVERPREIRTDYFLKAEKQRKERVLTMNKIKEFVAGRQALPPRVIRGAKIGSISYFTVQFMAQLN